MWDNFVLCELLKEESQWPFVVWIVLWAIPVMSEANGIKKRSLEIVFWILQKMPFLVDF